MGRLKRMIGEASDDAPLTQAGERQQLLGKIHLLVGSVRGVHEAGVRKVTQTRKDCQAVFVRHGSRFLDLASEFVEDLKTTLFK